MVPDDERPLRRSLFDRIPGSLVRIFGVERIHILQKQGVQVSGRHAARDLPAANHNQPGAFGRLFVEVVRRIQIDGIRFGDFPTVVLDMLRHRNDVNPLVKGLPDADTRHDAAVGIDRVRMKFAHQGLVPLDIGDPDFRMWSCARASDERQQASAPMRIAVFS